MNDQGATMLRNFTPTSCNQLYWIDSENLVQSSGFCFGERTFLSVVTMNRKTNHLGKSTDVGELSNTGSKNTSRRQVLKAGVIGGLASGVGLVGSGLAWSEAEEKASPPRRHSNTSSSLSSLLGSGDRTLLIHAPNLDQRLNITYFRNGEYDDGALEALDNLFRDRHDNSVAKIDTAIFDQLAALSSMFGGREVKMLHGFRSTETNEKMRRIMAGVAKYNYHLLGRAADMYVSDVPLAEVHIAALKLNAGGVGYFPRSHFVHIDSGPLRNWPAEYEEMAQEYRSPGI